MPGHRVRFHLADLSMQVAFWGLVLALVRLFWQAGTSLRSDEMSPTDIITSFLLIEVGFIAWVGVNAKRKAPACAECGRKFQPAKKVVGPPLCPDCRRRTLAPAQIVKEAARARWGGFALAGLVALIFAGVFYGPVGRAVGPARLIVLPLAGLGASFGLFFAIGLLVAAPALIRARRMRGDRFARARAAKAARAEGETADLGPIAVWYSGPDDPTPMLAEQAEVARRRFDDWLGPTDRRPRPFRFFVFASRASLVDFHGSRAGDLWNLDGLYLAGEARRASMTTEVVPYRLADPARTARSLFVYHAIESARGAMPMPWLQAGVVNAASGEGDAAARLDRKMLAAMARGSAFGVELFSLKAAGMMKWVRGWHDLANYARFVQFQSQSWSLVEFLGGPGASAEDRERSRALFGGLGRRDDPAEAFPRLLGRTPGAILDAWRGAVLARGIGGHGPPPGPVRAALTGRVLPLIADRGARLMDRVRAVRDVGRVGYALGADVLIGLLRDGGEVPRADLVWSLEAISGRPLGDDPDAWSDWWEGLPPPARGLPDEPSAPLARPSASPDRA